MVDKLVRVGLGLILFALVKGDVYCPTEERDAVYRFNVLCDTTSPCNNLNIYCPKNSYTDILWLDCKGAHACANISVFSAVTTRVRCRSRTGACENVTVHCGDDVSAVLPSSALSLFTTSDQGNQEERPVSCKFRHMDAYVTRNSFFGCYGDVKSCVVLASDDNAYTDSRMRCETTDTPCVMQCLTGSSCLGNELQCAATDQSLCQCQSEANCGTVETIDVRGETTDSAIETTEYSETTEIESVSVSTTQVAQPTMSTSATDSNSASTEAEATQTSSSAIASTTTVSSTQQEQTSTEASQTSTSSESTTSVTSSTVGSTSTSASSISTSSISTSSTSTSSTTASTTQVSTVNGLENYHQETVKDNSHVMKSWQLALAIVMPILGVAIICLIGAYILKRWKNSNNQSNKEVKNEDSEPHKSISAQSVDGLTSPATTSTTEV